MYHFIMVFPEHLGFIRCQTEQRLYGENGSTNAPATMVSSDYIAAGGGNIFRCCTTVGSTFCMFVVCIDHHIVYIICNSLVYTNIYRKSM